VTCGGSPARRPPGWRGNCGEEQEFRSRRSPHKPWLGDLVLTPKPASAWFNDILIACKRLPTVPGGREFREILGEPPTPGRGHAPHTTNWGGCVPQPTRVRLRHPAVDWKALVRFKKMIGLRGSPTMTPRQIWDFVLESPRLEKWLRETWTKAEREAAEARADARDVRIAERQIADLEAGRAHAISSEEMRERLGLGPRGDKPQTPYSHRYTSCSGWRMRSGRPRLHRSGRIRRRPDGRGGQGRPGRGARSSVRAPQEIRRE